MWLAEGGCGKWEWVESMGVVSWRWMWSESMGVVVRRCIYIYRQGWPKDKPLGATFLLRLKFGAILNNNNYYNC